jgi:hypothetical protein
MVLLEVEAIILKTNSGGGVCQSLSKWTGDVISNRAWQYASVSETLQAIEALAKLGH